MPFVEVEFEDLEFHETLGRGSAGSVYRGTWRSEDKVVAIKKLNLLESEAEVLSSLSHRNIIQFFGAVTLAPNFCIITEYAELGCLYEFLKTSNIDFHQIVQWAHQIALGMNYLHYEAPSPVIHRDLKSKNVVITADKTAKLCDFGSSRFHPHTTKLSLVGTFPWMAPEVIQQQPVTAACDVFSYSVVLWELLTHEVPYKGLEGLQVAWLVVAKEQRLTIPSSCPPVFANLMRKCWDQQPLCRLTFKEILTVLDRILENGTDVQEETDHFLSHKAEWKEEIEKKLEELKKMESALSSREQELKKKEKKLKAREKHLESISSRTAEGESRDMEAHDVEQWTEQDVLDWLFTLQDGQLAEYAMLFERHHINGRSLFLLKEEDLLQIGLLSLGHRKQLMEELDKLKHDSHRLLHFPPLQHHKPKSVPQPIVMEPIKKNLTIIYGSLCRKGLTSREKKWKYLVDFDDDGSRFVQTVQFVFSSSIPSDICTLSQSPYLSSGWLQAQQSPQLECIVNYKESVQRPRETLFQFHPEDSTTQELCVVLTLEPGKTSHALPMTGPSIPMSLTPGSPAPQLAGIWADRSHVIRPPPLNSDSLRRPLIPPSSPNNMNTGPLSSPSSSQSPRSSRDSSLTSDVGAGKVGGWQIGTGQVGAWGKPGSGAAVVKRMGEPHPQPPGPHLHTARQLKHSTSGPVHAYNQRPSNQGPRQTSDDQGSQGQWKQRGRESWHRVSSDRKGERSKVGPIMEQDERYQRSHSTTQAHQQSNRKPHPHRKPSTQT